MTRVKFRACTRSPKQGMEMQLPTSFVGRLICHLTKLHVVSKCHNGKFSSNGGIIDVDYHWVKSVSQARLEKRLPKFIGPQKNGVNVNEPNIAHRMDAVTGILFIPWCNGQVIQGYEGKGVLIKNDGYIYLQLNGDDSKIRVIPI